MKISVLFWVFIITATAGQAFAQGKAVTNADLTKYKEKRVEAERDLRENYARLGFSSPEERERRAAQSAKEAAELSAKLRGERIEREYNQAQATANAQYSAAMIQAAQQNTVENSSQTFFGGYFHDGRFYRRKVVRNQRGQQGYFAGGQFWPTGPRTPTKPIFRTRRR